jgi:hypothetical protein
MLDLGAGHERDVEADRLLNVLPRPETSADFQHAITSFRSARSTFNAAINGIQRMPDPDAVLKSSTHQLSARPLLEAAFPGHRWRMFRNWPKMDWRLRASFTSEQHPRRQGQIADLDHGDGSKVG